MTVFSPETKARLRQLARVIESAPEDTFNMADWLVTPEGDYTSMVGPDQGGMLGSCGTAGCIGGWAVSTFLPPDADELLDSLTSRQVGAVAEELLFGTDDSRGFYDMMTTSAWWQAEGFLDNEDQGLEDITKEMAAEALRGLAEGLIELGVNYY